MARNLKVVSVFWKLLEGPQGNSLSLKIIKFYNYDKKLGITLATEQTVSSWGQKTEHTDLWQEEEGFFYFNQANLNHCRGENLKIKTRSHVLSQFNCSHFNRILFEQGCLMLCLLWKEKNVFISVWSTPMS